MIIDVVMLSLTLNDKVFKTTQNAINTLHNSESEYKFNVYLIESDKKRKWDYDNCTIIVPDSEYSFHEFLNIGIKQGKSEWITCANNDLIFYPGWFSEIIKASEKYKNISCFSSWTDYNDFHKKHFLKFKKEITDYTLSLNTAVFFTSWCFTIKRELLKKVPLREGVCTHWGSDYVFISDMKNANENNLLVKNSRVDHLYRYTSKQLPREWKQKYTKASTYKYKEWKAIQEN